jgi:hypothetical protein
MHPALAAIALVAAAQFTPPDPHVFIHPEDQARARLLNTPCTEADAGRGCYRWAGRLIRDYPCSYAIDAQTRGSRPTDQCYKMEPARTYRGIWIDEFEGQAFIPDGTTPPGWPTSDPKSPGWREAAERARAARIWLTTDRVDLPHKRQAGTRRVLLEFVGRKTMYPGAFGHMGMSGHELIVDRVLSERECPKEGACG